MNKKQVLTLTAGLVLSGLHIPAIEPMIAGSLLVVGTLLMSPKQQPVAGVALAVMGLLLRWQPSEDAPTQSTRWTSIWTC